MSNENTPEATPRPDNAGDPEPAGSHEQYDRWLPEARNIPAAQVRSLNADASLARANAKLGVDAVLPHSDRLKRELPGISVPAISDLSNLGLALAYAQIQVDRYAPPAEVKKMLARASDLRGLLFSSADALAQAGVLPAAGVAKIREGRGGIDMAGDCVALAALFTKHALAVRGKTPVTAAQVRETAEIGARLGAALRPKGGRRKVDEGLFLATDARNRLWTLFERTWEDQVWRAGAWLFGRAVDRHVPPLHSRVAPKPRPKAPAPK